MKKIIVALDSFKGCMSSDEANEAARQGVENCLPTCEVVMLPVADGGEGMMNVLITATQGTCIHLPVHDPLMRPITAAYGLSGDGKTAFIEMATASGLPLVPPELRNPMNTTTYGTGEQIRHALAAGVRRFLIGLGGSATNDAGLGLLQALGFRFFDRNGQEINETICGRHLAEIGRIDAADALPALREASFTAACDVHNPFCGATGAAYVFAPQKGADETMVQELDRGLKQVAQVIHECTGTDITLSPGAGAAGGMGGGLQAFLNCRLQPGIELLLDALHFDEVIADADLITGEGRADRQTLMGKVPHGILKRAQSQNVPVLLLVGRVEDADVLEAAGFLEVGSITPPDMPLAEAMRPEVARANLASAVAQNIRTVLRQHQNRPEATSEPS